MTKEDAEDAADKIEYTTDLETKEHRAEYRASLSRNQLNQKEVM